MSEFKTFSGKTVDEAMEEACRHLGVVREKLEIEILSGGSSGIFGLVGKKKAQVRARLREEVNLRQEMAGSEKRGSAPRAPRQPQKAPAAPVAAEPVVTSDVAADSVVEPAVEVAAAPQAEPAPKKAPESRPAPAPKKVPVAVAPVVEDAVEEEEEDLAECDVEEMAAEERGQSRENRAPREERRAPETPPQPMTPELEAIVREVMDQMLDGILGQIPEFEISGHSERVSVLIYDEENSGLLIGREGQTLSAIQYLVNRIVIRRHGSPVKVQINTGEYRERQDDNLRKMAIFLADKAKTLGRPQSTKPLSSYHRRVVHLALQEDEAISTRSKGEGPLKRVLIVPRGGRGGEAQNAPRS